MSAPDLTKEIIKAWRLATAPARFLPDFFIPGAPKSCTSSLYDCLRMHPGFATSRRKEPTNFVHYPTSAMRSRMNFPLRIESLWRGRLVAGEASVEYFTNPWVPQNIQAIVPHAKLIFAMRDPLKRAWSDFKMFQRDGSEKESFDVVVRRSLTWLNNPADWPLVESALRHSHSPVRYLYAGSYMENIERWLKCFPRERCLFLLSEDYYADPQKVMDEVFQFIGLSPLQLPAVPHAREGGYKDWMDAETEALLREYFAPRNQKLAAFLGRSLPWT